MKMRSLTGTWTKQLSGSAKLMKWLIDSVDGDLDEATLRERKLMKWLIDSDDEDEDEARKRKKETKRLEAAKKKEQSRAAKLGQVGAEVEGDGIADDMKLEDVQKKIKELAQLRGRKGVDKHDMFRQFEALLRVSEKFGPAEPLTILTLFISAEFDQTTGAFQAMHLPTWTTVLLHCKKMLELLYSDPAAAARNLNSDEDEDEDEEEEQVKQAPQVLNARNQTVSSLTAFLEKLEDEDDEADEEDEEEDEEEEQVKQAPQVLNARNQ